MTRLQVVRRQQTGASVSAGQEQQAARAGSVGVCLQPSCCYAVNATKRCAEAGLDGLYRNRTSA